jgi:hypothetical protein
MVPYGTLSFLWWYHPVPIPQQLVKEAIAMVKPILVASAAGGTQGKTGRHVTEMLLEKQYLALKRERKNR